MKDANGILQAHGPDELRRRIDSEAPIARARTHTRAHGASNREPVITCHSLPEHSEIALSDQFVERHQHEMRYVAEMAKWFEYRDGRWQAEKTWRAYELAKSVCRTAAAAGKEASATTIATARTTAAIVTLARVDRALAARAEDWDTDQWLLNTPAGTVDLRTGKCHPHNPKDYITMIAATAPNSNCAVPVWQAFLARIFEGNRELMAFIQRLCGYTLTGDTREQALFFGHGTGANGKSVLLNTIAGILGDYHRNAPIETFTLSKSDRHPTELARLRGARLVTSVETEEGRHWAESRIKALTGGDTVSARFMRGDFFQFVPRFKLLIAGNHKPSLQSVDEAMRRRLFLLPFNVTIPPAERDHDLAAKLKAEWPGILAWMIEGCLAWQQEGLRPPAQVTAATGHYLEMEDDLGAWLSECCNVGPGREDSGAALFSSWQAWANRAGAKATSRKAFSQSLEQRGFKPRRTASTRLFEGLVVNEVTGDT